MSRNRFQEIKKFLHCADNANLGNEKMAKVKPLYDLLNENIRQFGIPHEILSIDESMTPYYGRHSCKQFARQKPIRFGFKSGIMASSTGMSCYVKIYESKSENQSSKEPLGSRVIRECISACTEPTKHRFYFDNFFTSYDIVLDLKGKEINATGTVRSNRTKHCPLPTAKDVKKKPRGSYAYRSDGNVEIVTWNDNAVVTLCSNCEGLILLAWQNGVGRVNIEQPFIVKAYYKSMGGVDLFDRSLSDFSPASRGKKWKEGQQALPEDGPLFHLADGSASRLLRQAMWGDFISKAVTAGTSNLTPLCCPSLREYQKLGRERVEFKSDESKLSLLSETYWS
ncbi:piggyBac transposable element-derived protein 3-like [Macrobrachium rosenbergii]|uniref:piggyBac transposable element-derived protein 3-like n=1 Tax=Macrobrachium rosenbergii TaxID=79674 RepID=UPI0034D5533A